MKGELKPMSDVAEWESLDWLSEARWLLTWASQVDLQTPIMIVIRHSHIEVSDNAQDLRTHGLTPLGHRMALKFGERLPPGRDVRLFYSPRLRCVQTACDIAEGYQTIGGNAELISDLRPLLGPYGNGEKIREQMVEDGGPAFVAKWSEKQVSGDIIEPIKLFRERFITEIIGRFAEAKPNDLQLHVTHDIVIMGARFALLKTQPTESNWAHFLGGFAAAVNERGCYVFENGEARRSHELASALASL